MKKLLVTWKGLTPIILHSCQCVNPLHPISIELKKLTSKRNKTEEDLIKISDLEWESGCYWKDGLGVYIPVENVLATIQNGAKLNKNGKSIEKYVDVADLYIPLDFGEKLTKEQLIADYNYRDTRPMTVNRSKILRTRPRFDTWKIQFTLLYHADKIDIDAIVLALENAGLYIGLCDSRPRYGKFSVIVEEVE
jgi:hypothetical protein